MRSPDLYDVAELVDLIFQRREKGSHAGQQVVLHRASHRDVHRCRVSVVGTLSRTAVAVKEAKIFIKILQRSQIEAIVAIFEL